jgi:hypothetical protein
MNIWYLKGFGIDGNLILKVIMRIDFLDGAYSE